MGLIIDRTEWVDSIYLIELTDPVQGGENGISNLQAKQLANRTSYLKALFDGAHSDSGNHELSNDDVNPSANILESKLQLDYATADIKAISDDVREKNAYVESRLDDVVGIKGSMVSALGKAIPLSWKNSERGFEFDMFAAVFTYIDEPTITITKTIKGDDSIDVTSTADLVVGHSYVLSDGNGSGTEVIEVKQILSPERFLATEKVGTTRANGILSQTSWLNGVGKANARNGGALISKTITILQDHSAGKFVARLKNNGATITPYYKVDGVGSWVRASFIETVQRVTGYSDFTYQVAGGDVVLKLVISTPVDTLAEIDHMCLLPLEQSGVAEAVKQPAITSPVLLAQGVALTPTITWTPYRSLYGVAQGAVALQVATDSAFSDIAFSYTGTNQVQATVPADPNDLDMLTTYYARVRQQDVEGVWSRWSETTYFFTGSGGETTTPVDPITPGDIVAKPSVVTPAAGAINVITTPTITSSAFSASVADTHSASNWQFSVNSGFTTLAHDSGEVANLTSYTVPGGVLNFSTKYYCRVRYKSTNNGWSAWSDNGNFTTTQAGVVKTPTIVFPANGVADISVTSTLTANAFASTPADTHSKSNWQVSTNNTFTAIVHDSGEVASLLSYTIPVGALDHDLTYYCRVRYKGTSIGWSSWSAASSFTTVDDRGEAVFTTPGTYNWVVPADVTSISTFLVQGGASGSVGWNAQGDGGKGGSTVWSTLAVQPGSTIQVTVGAGGSGSETTSGYYSIPGGHSKLQTGAGVLLSTNFEQYPYWLTATGSAVAAYKVLYSDGGIGGTGYSYTSGVNTYWNGGGGGGAGGYNTSPSSHSAYKDSRGGDGWGNQPPTSISTITGDLVTGVVSSYVAIGGAAMGGSANQGAGGVGLYGKGITGAIGGQGGSGGENSSSLQVSDAGNYGGGGGGASYRPAIKSRRGGRGGNGAVRIIWGTGRSFPFNAA